MSPCLSGGGENRKKSLLVNGSRCSAGWRYRWVRCHFKVWAIFFNLILCMTLNLELNPFLRRDWWRLQNFPSQTVECLSKSQRCVKICAQQLQTCRISKFEICIKRSTVVLVEKRSMRAQIWIWCSVRFLLTTPTPHCQNGCSRAVSTPSYAELHTLEIVAQLTRLGVPGLSLSLSLTGTTPQCNVNVNFPILWEKGCGIIYSGSWGAQLDFLKCARSLNRILEFRFIINFKN